MTDSELLTEEPCATPEETIEAILFAAGHPMTYQKLAEVLHYTPSQIKKIVLRMVENYDNRGFCLLAFDDSCQLCTREQHLPYIRNALGLKRGGNLSASSLEVLAIVAYNQPVTRAFIDEVRGVDSSYAVTSLLEKDMIAVTGHLDAPGRPSLLCTTEKFLRVFGLTSITELPPAEQLILPTKEAVEAAEEMQTATVEAGTEEAPNA